MSFMGNFRQKIAGLKCAIGRGKFAKRVACIMLAGAMTVPFALTAAACTVTIKDNGDGTYDITPADPNPNGNQGSQTPSGNQGGNQGGAAKPEPTEPDYSMYSPLLQTVLKSEYYNDLIEKDKNGELDHTVNGMPAFDGSTNLIDAIPYRFLRNEGADIENIQLDKIIVTTTAYTLNSNSNELYLKMDITYPNNNNNYTNQYLLKYDITEQEYNDLKMLNKEEYIQAGFFIQELDNQREPEVIGKFSIYTEIYKNFLQSFNKVELLYSVFDSNQITDYIVKSITRDEEENYYYLDMILMSERGSKSLHYGQISELNLRLNPITRVSFDNGIFNAKGFNSYWSEGPEEVQDITCFDAFIAKIEMNNLIK